MCQAYFLTETNNCIGNCFSWRVMRNFPHELSWLRDGSVKCNEFAPAIISCYWKVHVKQSRSCMWSFNPFFWCGGGGEGGTLFSRRLRLWSPEPRRDRGRNVKKKKWCFLKIFFIWMAMANTSHKLLWHGHQTGIATSKIGSIFFQFLDGISLVFRDQGSKLSEILGSWITKYG